MSEQVIELVKLDNGDIVLRHTDDPDTVLVRLSFSDDVKGILQVDQMEVARAMVEAGISSFQNIQMQRIEEAEQIAETGLLH